MAFTGSIERKTNAAITAPAIPTNGATNAATSAVVPALTKARTRLPGMRDWPNHP